MALVALAAQGGGLVLQKILERFDPGQQTEVLKAALNLLKGRLHTITLLGHRTKCYHRFAHSLRHGRCSSTWIQHPEPTGSGEQRPTQFCNIKRDIPRTTWPKWDNRSLFYRAVAIRDHVPSHVKP